MKKIIFVGYMGSGKSLIAKLLSEKTGFSFIELDKVIEERAELNIEMIFEIKGELFFRKLENDIFRELINSNEDMIISTGGGTPCYYNNHLLLLNENVIAIYLNASLTTLYDRLINQKEKRPLIANKNADELKDFIAKHLFERSYYYNYAKYKILVNEKSPENIVDELIQILA